MLTQKRRKLILELLEREDTVGLQQLVLALKTSESTVRRDLSQLEEEGLLIRVHGGAKRRYSLDVESTMQEKALQSPKEKEAIGRYAAQIIQKDDVIFLDAGATTLSMIPYLVGKQATVVTNGVQQAMVLSEHGIQTVLVGGKLKSGTKAVIGAQAVTQLQQYRFQKVFLGMNGVDMSFGYTTPDEEEAFVKRAAMEQGSQTYVLADDSKLTKVSFCKVASIEDAILITNTTKDKQEVRFRDKTAVLLVGI